MKTLFELCLDTIPIQQLDAEFDVRRYHICCGRNWLHFMSTLLCMISEHGTIKNIELMVTKGANLAVCDGIGDTPPHKSCRSTKDVVQKIQLFLNSDASVMLQSNRNGVTPLHIAASRKDKPS